VRAVSIALAAALALGAAGCGGGSTTKGAPASATTPTATTGLGLAQDASAKANARNVETAVEACFANNQTYRGCDSARSLGSNLPPIGMGPGQVDVGAVGDRVYAIIAHSQSGDLFIISRRVSGTIVRTCAPPSAGACHAGTW
jgi:hypothetical protein